MGFKVREVIRRQGTAPAQTNAVISISSEGGREGYVFHWLETENKTRWMGTEGQIVLVGVLSE